MHAYRYYIYNAAEISLQTYKLILGHEYLHDARHMMHIRMTHDAYRHDACMHDAMMHVKMHLSMFLDP